MRDETGERTERPTPLRLKEARRRGHVARSADVVSAAGALAALGMLALTGGAMLTGLTRMTTTLLSAPAGDLDALPGLLWPDLAWVLARAGGLVLAVLAVVVLANLVQVGLLATGKTFEPDFRRLSVADGLRRVLSGRSLVRALLAAAKLAGVAAVVFWTVRPLLARIAAAGRLPVGALVGEASALAMRVGLRTAGVLGALAALDWLYQRRRHLRELRMTRREVQEDLKRMEGDPLVRRRRRQAAGELARKPRSKDG